MKIDLKISKGSKELALIIGHLYGDGGITKNGRVHYCNSEDFLIKEFVDSMGKVFDAKPWTKKEVSVIRVRYPVEVGRILWELFGKFSFGKDTKIITSKIKKMPRKWKVKMLQAWFNDDGSVINFPQNYKVVAIKQKLRNLINFIKETLNEFEIKSQIIEDNGKWLLRIMGYENILKFKDKINFSKGYRKRKQLEGLLRSITRPHFVMKKKILDLIKQSPKSVKEISELLGLGKNVVYCHLHGWKRKKGKSNLGLIEQSLVKIKKQGQVNFYYILRPSPGFGHGTTGSSSIAQC